MRYLFKSFAVGIASGAITYAASIYTLGYTNAFAMPHGFSLALWMALVVFGVGASLVALLIHFGAIRAMRARVFPALASFIVTVMLLLLINGHFQHGYEALVAWLFGAGLASAIHHRLRPNNSFKPNPLRGSA